MFRRGDNGQHTLLLNVYVDDCTLAGGSIVIQREFWQEFRQKVRLEPEEYISEKRTKILGRLHSVSRTPKQITMTMTYDMRSYAQAPAQEVGDKRSHCRSNHPCQQHARSGPERCLSRQHDTSKVLRLRRKMNMDTSKVLHMPRKMKVSF